MSASVGPVGAALVLSDQQRLFAKVTLIAAAVKTIASIIVAPDFGMTGVALVAAMVVVILNVFLLVVAFRIK